MSFWKKRLTAKEVRRILKTLGFQPPSGRQHGGGHEQWTRDTPPPFRKVTVDAHVAPFGHDLIRYMANQAGVTVREFYAALGK